MPPERRLGAVPCREGEDLEGRAALNAGSGYVSSRCGQNINRSPGRLEGRARVERPCPRVGDAPGSERRERCRSGFPPAWDPVEDKACEVGYRRIPRTQGGGAWRNGCATNADTSGTRAASRKNAPIATRRTPSRKKRKAARSRSDGQSNGLPGRAVASAGGRRPSGSRHLLPQPGRASRPGGSQVLEGGMGTGHGRSRAARRDGDEPEARKGVIVNAEKGGGSSSLPFRVCAKEADTFPLIWCGRWGTGHLPFMVL